MRVSLLGVEFHSGNRGCGALAYSIVEILKKVCIEKKEDLHITGILFLEQSVPDMKDEIKITIECIKIAPKKLDFWKQCKQAFRESDVVIDFSMGDSFSDIYGKKRFYLATLLKLLAIRNGKFIMGPQTIGPFDSLVAQRVAAHILKNSWMIFVRDTKSMLYAKEFSGVTPLLTTDVAFSLPYKPRKKQNDGKIHIGFNPSGLLWDGTKEFSTDKHLVLDYKEYVRKVMDVWTSRDGYVVHLIPHVFSYDGVGPENDMRACMEIQKEYPNTVIEIDFDSPMEIKSVISTMDVFIGARMHATIAAFSSGVATIPFSYSRKFEGLYQDLEYCYLISATTMDTTTAVQRTIDWVDQLDMLHEEVLCAQKNLAEKQKVFYDALLSL